MNSRIARCGALSVALLLALATGVRAAKPRLPIFFEHPDPRTAGEIRSAIDDLSQARLFSDHTRGREAAIRIGYWAVTPLLRLIDGGKGDASEVRNAALALGEIGDPRARDDLLGVAEHSNHQFVGSFATLALGRFRDPSLLPTFDTLVRTKQKSDRRIAAVLALARLRSPDAYAILARTVRDADEPLLREAATFCLGLFPDQALVRTKTGRVPCQELQTMLRSSRTPLRRAAMVALALLGHRDLKPLYEQIEQHELEGDVGVRCIALLALGRFPDSDVTSLLLETIENRYSPPRLKEMAAFLLKDRTDPAALARLKKATPRETDTKIRAVLCLALSNFEDDEVARILASLLTDRKKQVQAAAAIGLSRLTDPALKGLAVTCLTKMLQGEFGPLDPDVRQDMQISRDSLKAGRRTHEFVWLGNEDFAEDLPKDVEEKVLDLVNREAWQVLGLNSLTDIKKSQAQKDRFRVDDRTSPLHDLREHLSRHPYFGPGDIPEPHLVLTPRGERGAGAPAARPAGKGK